MKVKSLLITAAMLAGSVSQVCAADVTATWAMDVSTANEIAAIVSDETISASFNIGSDIVNVTKKTAVNNDKTENLFDATCFQVKNRSLDEEKGNVNENEYIEFVITATNGSYKPTNISFYAGNFGFGDGRYAITVFDGDQNIIVANEETPARPESGRNINSKDECFKTYAINGFKATEKPVTIRINLWNRNTGSGKYIGFNDVKIDGTFTAAGEEPVVPAIPEDAVVAPLAAGTYYDVTKALCEVANSKNDNIENTKAGTTVDFPFYLEEEATIYFYLEQGAKERSNGYLLVSLDGEQIGEHEVIITGNWATYSAVSIFRLENLSAGKHVVTVARDDTRCTESYAGNWRVSLHAEDTYSFAPVNLAAGNYNGGARAENNSTNVGNIKDGASSEYRIYIPEPGIYEMQIGISNINGGTCKVTVKEEGIENSFETAPVSRAYGDVRHISLGEIKTPGIKTLRLDFSADHTGYITNYDNLSLVRTGDLSGVADIEAAEVVAVEYYNLQGVHVEAGARGTLIRVSTDANGSRKAEKVIVR